MRPDAGGVQFDLSYNRDMKRAGFDAVRAIGASLPDAEEASMYGAFCLKVRGKMFVCQAINKAAEPNTLAVRMDFAQRDALLDEDPATYYLKDHYVNYPCILVRLSRVHPDALRDLVQSAHRFVSATIPSRPIRRRVRAAASSATPQSSRRTAGTAGSPGSAGSAGSRSRASRSRSR
jgi:hypothetical protein